MLRFFWVLWASASCQAMPPTSTDRLNPSDGSVLKLRRSPDRGQTRTKRKECLWISPNAQKTRIASIEEIDGNPNLSKQKKHLLKVHKARSTETENAIRQAIHTLKRTKKKVSKTAVAQHTGLSRQQITTRYAHLF